ncbi:hypothetical protein L7F22_008446 [Adiantum nelumboides]|nr:hypothetical protein [Adiantum nelumboides]
MQHMMSATIEDVNAGDVWYVNLGDSNHMTYDKNWFHEMHEPQRIGYVEIGDDSTHPIEHVGKVSLCMPDGQKKHMTDVLHVPTITKNLVSVGQMVEQGLQVKFNKHGCFVEDFQAGCKLVAKGKRIGRMFTLDVNMPTKDAALFTQGSLVITDLDIWHKLIGHANVQRLKSMQSKGIVTGLPRFVVSDMQKECGACQFGKQARHSFPQDRNVSSKVLDVIHTDVWGPT